VIAGLTDVRNIRDDVELVDDNAELDYFSGSVRKVSTSAAISAWRWKWKQCAESG
jgi:hypothetical protein